MSLIGLVVGPLSWIDWLDYKPVRNIRVKFLTPWLTSKPNNQAVALRLR